MSLFDIKEQFATKQVDKWQYIDKMYEVHSMLFDYASFIKGTNISKIEIQDCNVIMTFRDSGVKFICAAGDKRLAPFDALNFGGYEEEELSMQMALIGKHDVVFDIGANYGWYAAHIAKRFPEAKIFSFEPIPKTYKSLQKNLSLNNIHNVTAVNIGMGEQKDKFVFYYDPQLSVNASMSNLTNAASVESTVCEVSTLDHFSNERGLKVDFIKCDIEGAELLAFKGGRALLERDKPVIFSEMLRKWTAKFNYHPNDIIDFLSVLGYTCFVTSEGKLIPFSRVDENTSETNYFFLHAEKHIGLIEKYFSEL